MNVDFQLALARAAIATAIDQVIERGEAKIDRTVADARAWIRHWPLPLSNRRSAGQFLRHMRARR